MKIYDNVKIIIIVIIYLFFITISSAYAKVSVIPLPAFSTSPNEGESYGVLPVWLFINNEEKIKRIVAPSLTYNSIFGVTGTFRVFGYPKNNRKYEFIYGRSTEDDQTIKLRYFIPDIYKDYFQFDVEVRFINDISYRFFGIGPNTKEEDETNYTHNNFRWHGNLTYKLSKDTDISFQERFSRVRIKRGKIESLPYAMDKFPDVPGMNGANTWAHMVVLTYDNRDIPDQPTKGIYASLFVEYAQKVMNTDSSFLKYGIHVKQLLPSKDKRFTLVLRGLFEKQDGHNVPFYERSMLGGEDTLRGFGSQRFFDNNRVLFTAEERILMFKLHIFKILTEWEISPFVETGRVFDSYNLPLFKEFKLVSGVGIRAIVRPNVVGRVDIGIGPEGVKVFVGLGYPF